MDHGMHMGAQMTVTERYKTNNLVSCGELGIVRIRDHTGEIMFWYNRPPSNDAGYSLHHLPPSDTTLDQKCGKY